MNHESIREFALSLPLATEHLPFDEYTLVFKVHGKMFLTLGLDAQPPRMNVKNDPEVNIALRERYDWIIPGYNSMQLGFGKHFARLTLLYLKHSRPCIW